MNQLLNKPVFMQIPGKTMKIISWTVCFSLVLLLLAGGIIAYGIPYQGLDMPIRLHSNEEINWTELIKEKNKFFVLKEIAQFKDKIMILKWDLGYLRQAVRIGRGPPTYALNL